ncbi:cytochrome P450 315a1, mitochondrial isoform X2 [Daktulosphaira vitifoliae]|uniref:cytochrome P450 315a1, mitochondrial isoform X2 n=1 Tax=Daktulosphaira vitifoliae TaxID=58002 RepID=UPI0021AA4A6D|nr:cytochrome P450 315a1, mitochondrial isoform X2 [Daktulosphaira vitifoliae]
MLNIIKEYVFYPTNLIINYKYQVFKRLVSNQKNTVTKNNTLKQEIPVVRGLPLVGTTFSIIAAGGGRKLHEYIDKQHKKYGPVFREKFVSVDAIWISNPNDMKLIFAQEGKYARHVLPEAWLLYNETYGQQRGLYFMDGEEWWTYRKILNKFLFSEINNNYIFESSKLILNEILKEWENNNDGLIQHLEADLYKISISFMVAYLVGNAFKSCRKEILSDINNLAHNIQEIFKNSVKFTVIPAKTAKLFKLKIWNDFVKSVNDSMKYANNLVTKLMEYEGDGLLKSISSIHNISDDMIKRLIIDFILAAGDTTAYSTQWTLYSLGLHPIIQDNLRQSLCTNNFWENDYLNNILKEVLRLYPLAPFLTRILSNDTFLTHHVIPAHSLVILSMFSSSRNEKYFKNSNEFKPDRWLRLENNKYCGVNEPFASLPFGFGARSCIGQKMAHIQMCSTISECIKKYKIKTMKPVSIVLDLITVPDEQIQLKLQKL